MLVAPSQEIKFIQTSFCRYRLYCFVKKSNETNLPTPQEILHIPRKRSYSQIGSTLRELFSSAVAGTYSRANLSLSSLTCLDPGTLLHVALRGWNWTSLEPISSLLLVLNVISLDPLAFMERLPHRSIEVATVFVVFFTEERLDGLCGFLGVVVWDTTVEY